MRPWSPEAPALLSRRWSTAALMALLAAITALAPFSLQIFLPALPAIQASFAVAPGVVQLALSLSILANALANLAYGPLSDRFGRRPVLLVGLAAFIAGSLGCALASSIELLIGARVVQSIGGAAGMVLARAIVRDLYDRERSASIIAYLTMAMVVAPMLAPTIGAVLLDVASWRAIFVVATGIGVALTWPIIAMLAETRSPEARRIVSTFAGAGTLLRSGQFWSYVLQSTFGICVFFAFISGAPYFMMNVLRRPATEYGLWFILVSAAFMAGNLVAGRFSARIGLDRMVLIGALLALTGAGLALALLLGGAWTPLALFGPMMAAGLGNGFSVPNAQAGAVSVDPLLAGTASGIAGFSQMFVAALVSQAVGMLQNGTPYPMAGFMAGCAVLSLAGFLVPRRLALQRA
jgi:DHA1 family bicyclomycin/chloramphenicol resistance-like MFS transporter